MISSPSLYRRMCSCCNAQGGLALATEAMKFINGKGGDALPSRLAVVHNPIDDSAPLSPLQLIMAAAAALPARRHKLPGALPLRPQQSQ